MKTTDILEMAQRTGDKYWGEELADYIEWKYERYLLELKKKEVK